MSENDETRWRAGLEGHGVSWVRAKLQERAGSPDDEIFDVVFTGRNPTRAFCQAWCAEQDNRVFRMSGTTKIALVLAVVLVVFIIKAFFAWRIDGPVAGTGGRAPVSQVGR